MGPRKSSDVAVLLLFQFLPEISFILLVTAAHNPLRKVEFRYSISYIKDVIREGKESYIGDFKCVLGNYVDIKKIVDKFKIF